MKNPLNIIELRTKSIAIKILANFCLPNHAFAFPFFRKKKKTGKRNGFHLPQQLPKSTRSIVMQMQCSESHVFYEPEITEWPIEIRTRPIW